jgi:hypothetical protein
MHGLVCSAIEVVLDVVQDLDDKVDTLNARSKVLEIEVKRSLKHREDAGEKPDSEDYHLLIAEAMVAGLLGPCSKEQVGSLVVTCCAGILTQIQTLLMTWPPVYLFLAFR